MIIINFFYNCIFDFQDSTEYKTFLINNSIEHPISTFWISYVSVYILYLKYPHTHFLIRFYIYKNLVSLVLFESLSS